MDHHRRPPSLNLISTSSPARPVSTSPTPLHRQSQSPFRYVHFDQSPGPELDEKATPLSNLTPDRKRSTTSGNPTSSQPNRQAPSHPSASSSRPLRNHYSTPLSGLPSPFLRQPAPLLLPSHTPTYSIPRRLRIANRMKPWTPIIMYGLTSLAFLVAIAMYRTEVFSRESSLAPFSSRYEAEHPSTFQFSTSYRVGYRPTNNTVTLSYFSSSFSPRSVSH